MTSCGRRWTTTADFNEALAHLLEYVEWDARQNRRASDGARNRDHLEAAAAKGNEDAIRALVGPPLPESVAYLYEWAKELFGRSGISQAGIHPVSHAEIAAWARLNDRRLMPHEVAALLAIDAVMRTDDEKKAETEEQPPRDEAWPEKKS